MKRGKLRKDSGHTKPYKTPRDFTKKVDYDRFDQTPCNCNRFTDCLTMRRRQLDTSGTALEDGEAETKGPTLEPFQLRDKE